MHKMDARTQTGRLLRQLLAVVALGFALLSFARAAQDFLEPEKAFQFSARMVSADQAEVSFQIAKGYYLYR